MTFEDGMKKFKEGDYEGAAHEFVTVTEQDDQNHKAWNALGICLSKTGQYESAATCFDNAQDLDPANVTYKKNQQRNDKKRGVEDAVLELDDEPVPVKKRPINIPTSGYQRNWLQILLFFIPFICMVINPLIGFLSLIGCAWYIKTDAESLNAGGNPKGSVWGKLKGWEWAVLLFLFWFLMPLYSWKRQQIYEENLGYGSSSELVSEPLSVVKIEVGILGLLFLCVFIAVFAYGMGGGVSQPTSAQNVKTVQLIQPISTSAVIQTAIPTEVLTAVPTTLPPISVISPVQAAVPVQVTAVQTVATTTTSIVEQTPDKVTIGESNAVKEAKRYLESSSFSRDGLIHQLEYAKFTPAEAEYGVSQSGADWNEQAAKEAKRYLESSSFSRDGLIHQLEYAKFTPAEAEYGVSQSDADWNEQAAKTAKNYLESSSFSRDGLIKQLEYEKFTPQQAEYGAKSAGY